MIFGYNTVNNKMLEYCDKRLIDDAIIVIKRYLSAGYKWNLNCETEQVDYVCQYCDYSLSELTIVFYNDKTDNIIVKNLYRQFHKTNECTRSIFDSDSDSDSDLN